MKSEDKKNIVNTYQYRRYQYENKMNDENGDGNVGEKKVEKNEKSHGSDNRK